MTITTHVTNLELSRRLKELKVPQKSYFEWVDEGKDGSVLIKREYLHLPLGVKKYSAYLASELGEMLPKGTLCEKGSHGGWWVSNIHREIKTPPKFGVEGKTEIEAKAKMLIYLIENHLISVEELGK